VKRLLRLATKEKGKPSEVLVKSVWLEGDRIEFREVAASICSEYIQDIMGLGNITGLYRVG